ncbi:glycoside hydrolase family 30 beta sandwich domain-containing protein [Micromonospora sp. WMMD1102]|uniref:glycoside hydrolase family 30 beta sandwich domain-containing protein n=1 Tax=Micromonospora sp. WMMD1102 TaxID=3016105 RepID=UPI0024153234|nr:glycoside hydrolase family 30 beta sandwich domain-containing protein [Micromonospora sp. WMMD1102]MDG4788014.1 glycoside hydrolase family 30 beta sandwich domain-containing protein [Micromonospora sp. WMMD1102]
MNRSRILMVAAATALTTVAGVLTAPPLSAATPDLTVNTASTHQTIDGFGAATPIFGGSGDPWTDSETQTLVGTGPGQLGLSIIRTVVSPVSSEWNLYASSLRTAKSYGSDVKILASPWTAPANFKTNNSRINGGKLRTDYYDDYAEHLNGYVQYMKSQGVAIDVTSVQNEPDWHPDYDSMDWTGTELRNWVRDQGAKVRDTRLMVGESLRFNRGYSDPTLQDATARNNIGYVGGHLYDAENSGNLSPYPLANQYGKHQWMTEWNLHAADGNGSNIWGNPGNATVWNESLDDIMRTVHRSMESGWSAYVWWYGRRFYSFVGDGESQYGTTKGQVLRRGQAFSQYARYVRPGDRRVAVTKSSRTSGLEVTAYQGRGKVTLVILNRSNSAVNNAVVQTPQSISNAEYTVTSQSLGAAAQPVSLGDGQATVNIPARSISTVTVSEGPAPTTPPTGQPSTNPTTPPSTTPPSTPPAGGCTASTTTGTVWGDRYNTSVTVSGAANWTVVVAVSSPQSITTTWSGTASLSNNNTVLTMRSNGSGNTFGFTTMTNGNSGGRPQVRSCTAG